MTVKPDPAPGFDANGQPLPAGWNKKSPPPAAAAKPTLEADDHGDMLTQPRQKEGDFYGGAYKVPPKFAPMLDQASTKYGVPLGVLHWVGYHESMWNPTAVGSQTSSGTAKGMFQFMDGTAKELGINPLDPAQAIDGAARYLRKLYDETGDWTAAVEKYGTFSTGLGARRDAMAKRGFQGFFNDTGGDKMADRRKAGASDVSPMWNEYGITGADDEFSDPPDKYTGWDQPGEAPPPKPTEYSDAEDVPLANDPDTTYGSILPFSKDNKTGEVSLAVPEFLRAPVRGVVEGGQEARGVRPVDDPAARSDIFAATGALGGARAGVAEPKPGPVIAPKSPIRPAAIEAQKAGYVLPPASISEKPGIVSQALAGWSGKIKTQQAASAKNQLVTNDLATQSLGLPKGTVLTQEVFNKVRAQAGEAYKDVVNAVPTIKPDQPFRDIVQSLGGQNSQAAKAFPKITNNAGIKELVGELDMASEHPTGAWVELVKELRFSANSNLKSIGDPSKHALGLAQREAANAVDDLMERQITAAGNPQAINAYRQARQLIAKSWDVEGATNPASGDVSARGLAKLMDKGRPLTGELKTIAEAGSAFPKSMQDPAGFGDNEAFSALDFFGSAAAVAHGNPTVAGAILARPVARSVLLSKPYQQTLFPRSTDTMSRALRIPNMSTYPSSQPEEAQQ